MNRKTLTLMIMLSFVLPPAMANPTAKEHIKKAQGYEMEGRHREAERHYMEAVRRAYSRGQNNPKLPDILYKVGEYYRKQNDYLKAERYFEKGLVYKQRAVGKINFDFWKFHISLGLLYQTKRDFFRSKRHFLEALRLFEEEIRKKPNMTPSERETLNRAIAQCLLDYADTEQNITGYHKAQHLRKIAAKINADPSKVYPRDYW